MFFKKIFKKREIIDDWIYFSREKKDKKSFLKLNYAFFTFWALKNYKYFLEISLFLDDILEKNHDIFYEIEDRLSEVLEEDLWIVFVWTKKTDKKYFCYFYSKNNKSIIWETINKVMQPYRDLYFSVYIKKDKSWYIYFKDLIPSNFEYQKYQNENKIWDLYKDYLGKQLKVYYFISYKNKKVLDYFKSDLKDLWFELLMEWAWKRKNYPYALKISKKQDFNLETINNSAYDLIKLTEKYNFKYEWWVLK